MGTESRMLAPRPPGPGGGGGAPADDSGLGFALSFMSGRGLLTTRDRRVGPVTIKALAMEIPSISFPFDVSGGAERFKPRRCTLRHLAFGLDSAGVQSAFVAADLAKNGLSGVKVGIYDGFLEVAGAFRVGDSQADFTCRAALLPLGPHELQVVFYDTRLWGWLPLPAALLPVYLRRSFHALPFGGSRAGAWTLRPGEFFARDVLPRAGWKIPDMHNAHVVGAEVARGQISLTVGRVDEPTAKQIVERSPPAAAMRAADGIATFASAEQKLAQGAVRDAYVELRDALDEGRGGGWARERLLQIGAADPELTVETQQLATETLERNGDDVSARLALAAMAQRDGQLDVAAQHYRRLAEMMRERKERFDAVAAELALGSATEVAAPDEALAAYERASARAHDSAPVHERIMRLRRTLGNADGAAEAGERWVALVEGDADKAVAHARLGQLYLRDSKDFRRARLHFEKAMRLSPDAPAALEGMAETYAARGEPARAAGFLARLAEQAEASHDVERIVSLNLRLGEIWQTWLHDPESAAARYHRVLDVAPEAHAARLLLAQLAEDRNDKAQARRLYEDVIARIEASDQSDTATPELVKAYARLGQLFVDMPGSYTTAVEHLSRALELDPASPGAAAALAKLLRSKQEWRRLITVLENLARHSKDALEVRTAWLEAARLEIDELKNPHAAQAYLETILDARPQDNEALTLLAPILLANNNPGRLAQRLEAAAKASSDGHAKGELLFRLAETQQLMGADARVRRRILESTLEANPHHAGAARALVELLRDQGDVMALAAAYDRLAVATGDPTGRAAALLAKARLLSTQPGQAASALSAVQAAVAAEGASVEGWLLGSQVLLTSGDLPRARDFLRDALPHFGDKVPPALYVRLAELARQAGDGPGEADALTHALQSGGGSEEVARRFVALLMEQGRGRETLPWLNTWAEAGAPLGRGDAWLLSAEVLTQLNDLESAVPLYDKVMALPEPAAFQAAEALEKLARRLNHPNDVVRALHKQISRDPVNASAELLLRLMEAQRAAGLHEPAMETAQKVLERAPQTLVAHQYLSEQQEANGQWQQALDHLLYMVLVCPPDTWDRNTRRHTFRRAAALAREIRPSALHALEETFDKQFPEMPPDALKQPLADLLRADQAWQRLYSLREMQLQHASIEQTIPMQKEMASLLHERLGRSADAVVHYRAVVAADPQDATARDALLAIYTQEKRWRDAAQLQFALSQLVIDPKAAMKYAVTAARTYNENLNEPELARQVLRTLFDRTDLTLRDPAFFQLLRQLQLHAETAQLLELDLADNPAPDDGRFKELVMLLAGPLADSARALTWCQRMREAFADADEPRRMEVDILKAHPDLGSPAAAMQIWADARTGASRAAIFTELSKWAQSQGDDATSVAALAGAAEANPGDLGAIDGLVERYKARGEWTQVLHWLLRAAEGVPAGPERDRRLHRAAEVALDYANDNSAAVAALTKLQVITPADRDLVVQLCTDSGDWAVLETWKEFKSLPADVLLRGAKATAKSGPPALTKTYVDALLAQNTHVEEAWHIATEAWRRNKQLADLAHWRLAYAEKAPEEHALWARIVGHAELLEAGEPAPQGGGQSLEEEFARADLTKVPSAWGVFLAARALGQRTWVARSAQALETLLGENDTRRMTVVRALVQQELDGGDPNVAVSLARRLVAMNDPDAPEWLESALVMAGQGDELLDILVRRAERGGPDAAMLWTRVAGLWADRKDFKEASQTLMRVPSEARTKRWGELQYNIGKQNNDASMQLVGAQVAAQFSLDREERATWLRRAGSSLWWDLNDQAAGLKLIEQAQAIAPLNVMDVISKSEMLGKEEARRFLEEAVAVMPKDGTSPLWRELALLRPPGAHQMEALENARRAAGANVEELNALADSTEHLGLRSMNVAVHKTLYELQPEAFFLPYADALERAQDWRAWVDLVEKEGNTVEQLERAAVLAGRELRDPDRSLTLWERAVKRHPSVENLQAALHLAQARGKHAQAVAWLEQLLELVGPDATERAALLTERLQLLELLGDTERARAARRALVEEGYGSAADKLLLAQDDADLPPAEAAALLEQVADSGDATMRGPALVAAADAWHRAGNLERAAAPLRAALDEGQDTLETHRLALAVLPDPENLPSARRLLELNGDTAWPPQQRATLRFTLAEEAMKAADYAAAESLVAEASQWDGTGRWAQIMEVALEKSDKRGALADLWLQLGAKGPWQGAAAVERLQRAAQIFADEKRPDEERRALAALATLKPDDAAVGDRLLALTAAEGDRAAFAALLQARHSEAATPEARRALALQAAPLWVEHYQDGAAASAALEACLAEGITPPLLSALRDLYVQQDKRPAYVALLRRYAATQEGTPRLATLVEAADFAAPTDAEEAFTGYLDVVRVDPSFSHALDFCEAHGSKTGRWPEVLEVLEMRAGQTSDPKALSQILGKAAAIARDELHDSRRAGKFLQGALKAAPQAADLRERLGRLHLDQDSPVAAAEVLAAATSGAPNLLAFARELLPLLDVRDQGASANSLRQWLSERFPDAPEAVAFRLQQARERGDHGAVLESLLKRLEAEPSLPAGERAQLQAEAAQLAQGLDKGPQAIALWLEALEGPEPNPAWLLKAAQAAQASDNPDLVKQVTVAAATQRPLVKAAADAATGPEQGTWLQLLAAAYMEAGEDNNAVAALESLLELSETQERPLPEAAADTLASLYTRYSTWRPLAQLHRRVAVGARSPERQAAAWYAAGLLWRDQLEEPAQALDAFRAALGAEPDHAQAQLAAGLLLAATGAHREALPLLEAQVQVQDSAVPLDQLRALLACYEATESTAEAIDLAGLLLARDPAAADVRLRRATLLQNADRADEAQADWQAYLAANTDDAAANALAHRHVAAHALAQSDVATAATHLDAARQLAPDDPALVTSLRQVQEKRGDWPAAATLRRQEAERETDPAAQGAHYLALADIYATHLQDADESVRMLERAAESIPRDVPLLKRLLAHYATLEDKAKFLLAAERLLSVAPAAADAPFLRQLAEAYEPVDAARAHALYGKALALAPDDTELQAKRHASARAAGDWAAFAPAEEEAIAAVADPVAKAQRYAALADAYIQHLGDLEKAIAALTKACAAQSADETLWRTLADAYALDAKYYDKAAQVYRRLLVSTPLDDGLLRILARLAGQSGETDRSYGYYACLLCLVPQDEEAGRFVNACRAARPALPPRALTDADRTQGLFHPQMAGPAEEFFAPLARFAELVYPGDLTKRGITDRDKLGADDERVQALTPLIKLLNAPSMAMYLWPNGGYRCDVELTKEPTLLLGGVVAAVPEARHRAFAVARAAELYRTGHTLTERASGPELQALMAAMCLAVDPTAKPPGASLDVQNWAQIIAKPMSGQIRATMAPRAANYLKAAGSVDLNRWRNASAATANRVALLLTCDAEEAMVTLLRGLADEPPRDQFKALMLELPEALDLFRFAQSDAYFGLRRALGVALRRSEKKA